MLIKEVYRLVPTSALNSVKNTIPTVNDIYEKKKHTKTKSRKIYLIHNLVNESDWNKKKGH